MFTVQKFLFRKTWLFVLTFALIFTGLVGCDGPAAAVLEGVDFQPAPSDDWKFSKPEEHGLDPDLIADLNYDAAQLPTAYSLFVFKNGYLIEDDNFNLCAA